MTACDIGMAYFFLHLMTVKVYGDKCVFIQVRSTAD